MKADKIRIYAQVLEQGLDFKSYIEKAGFKGEITIAYAKKADSRPDPSDSLVRRIRRLKDIDVLITAEGSGKEYPLLMVEYSTAVPTDDHRMQRSDVYFWGGVFRIPVMKISPDAKGMDKAFGGGDSITSRFEAALSLSRGCPFYPISWDMPKGMGVLPAQNGALSCIPFSGSILSALKDILSAFDKSPDLDSMALSLTDSLKPLYKAEADLLAQNGAKAVLKPSLRFSFTPSGGVSVKINRFGHAMDPERGVLFFVNMLAGTDGTEAEIQIGRPRDISCRGGYKSLFDGLSREQELLDYVQNIIDTQNNTFTPAQALHVFLRALHIEARLNPANTAPGVYFISDNELSALLSSGCGMAVKSIFFLASCMKLTDSQRNTICLIRWNAAVGGRYLASLPCGNLNPLALSPMTAGAGEDIVTYASCMILRQAGMELLAVSYPGAQGDRCILTGSGRKIKRIYVDIIALEPSSSSLILLECKERFSRSGPDALKLCDIKASRGKTDGLMALLERTGYKVPAVQPRNILTSLSALAGKAACPAGVDIGIAIAVAPDKKGLMANYSVACYSPGLQNLFSALGPSSGGVINGSLRLPEIFLISE